MKKAKNDYKVGDLVVSIPEVENTEILIYRDKNGDRALDSYEVLLGEAGFVSTHGKKGFRKATLKDIHKAIRQRRAALDKKYASDKRNLRKTKKYLLSLHKKSLSQKKGSK